MSTLGLRAGDLIAESGEAGFWGRGVAGTAKRARPQIR